MKQLESLSDISRCITDMKISRLEPTIKPLSFQLKQVKFVWLRAGDAAPVHPVRVVKAAFIGTKINQGEKNYADD